MEGLTYNADMSTDTDADPRPASPVVPGPGSPAAAVGPLLDAPDAADRLASMDRATLTALTTTATGAARHGLDPEAWLARLGVLRMALLLRGERPLLARVLSVQARLALELGKPELAARAADTLWGVRELLGEPWKAHEAMLLLARAQAEAEDPVTAEATLLKAMEVARSLAPAGNLVPASAAVARTLTQLGALLQAQGRGAEAAEWLQGAVDIAPDEETREAAVAVLGRLGGYGPAGPAVLRGGPCGRSPTLTGRRGPRPCGER